MQPHREAPVVRDLLRRAVRRHAVILAAYGAAAGLAVSVVIALAARIAGWQPAALLYAGVMLAGAGAIAGVTMALRAHVAYLIERRAPASRNLIITAAELLNEPERGGSVRVLVLREADSAAAALDPVTLFPARRAMLAFTVAAAAFMLTLPLPVTEALQHLIASKANTHAAIDHVHVIVTPPAYAGLPADTLNNPSRIEVRAGSTLRFVVQGAADGMTLETVDGSASLDAVGRAFIGHLTANADGFIAIAATVDTLPAVKRLIGLSVIQDQAPRVRVTAPGRDLFVPAAPASLDVQLEADDDLALAGLVLRYTRVSGSGEQFTFTDGEMPLRIERVSGRTWKARGVLTLDTMKLAAGDMIVYRGIASDRRPGAQPAESDTYILEVTGPGALAAGGFATDDERDRYAVSQQMLIVFTERLDARRPTLTPDALKEESMRLAAVQRQVRAEFVFMMGGELADDVGEAAGIMELNEHDEAEAEDDILAGRLANRGRVELARAIRAMSGAATALNDADLTTALEHERTALAYLQRAFSRTRYILRTLTERERLDLSRRLTGTLADAGRDVRPVIEPERDPQLPALRSALAGIAALAGADSFDADAARRASAIAQSMLRVDPGDEVIREVAAQLNSAATAIQRQQLAEARDALQSAALQTAAVIRAALPAAPAADPVRLDNRRLEGALVDALRRQGLQ